MDMYKHLEERVYNEVNDPLHNFYIHASLENIKDIDPIDDFLHPMLLSDLEEIAYNMEEIAEKLQKGEDIILSSVFMELDNLMFQAMLGGNKTYKGYVKTESKEYEISFTLKQSKKYIDEVEKLYRIFQSNGVGWATINCPYVYKFVDIVLNSTLNITENEKIIEINFDLAEYEKYKKSDVIPLWNVKYLTVKSKSFPRPAIDLINYDHHIELTKYGMQNGYLVALGNGDYKYSKRHEDDLIIVSRTGEQNEWNILMIENTINLSKKSYSYQVLSNKRDLGFVGRYASVKSIVVRTRGEVARVLQSYEMSQELSFQEIEVINSYSKPIQTINLNEFIDDNIRVDSYKKIMILKFKSGINKNDFLIYDKMSFFVSEIQFLFPEYKCIGELI